ncbi:unnamed protein product [Arabis nemorensis]|uniref:Uncharacterized protein n=1 Tax=Arabis nemorensis TaxID=586526 RepID=A0A565BDY3_9BRAS|nr:unnamed protein product [Arabis nemorensis]
MVSSNLNIGKRLVFGYESVGEASSQETNDEGRLKIVDDAVNSGLAMRLGSNKEVKRTQSCTGADQSRMDPFLVIQRFLELASLRLALPGSDLRGEGQEKHLRKAFENLKGWTWRWTVEQ